MDEYKKLHEVFKYFGRTQYLNSLQKDVTLSVADLINMFKKAKILYNDRISIIDFIEIVERYHANGTGAKLNEKLSEISFKAYIKANPNCLKINREILAINEHNARV